MERCGPRADAGTWSARRASPSVTTTARLRTARRYPARSPLEGEDLHTTAAGVGDDQLVAGDRQPCGRKQRIGAASPAAERRRRCGCAVQRSQVVDAPAADDQEQVA